MIKYINYKKCFIFEYLYDLINKSTLDELLIIALEYKIKKNKLYNQKKNVDVATKYANNTYVGFFKNKTQGSAVLFDTIFDLKENIESYKWLHNKLENEDSKNTLICNMLFRLFCDIEFIRACYDQSRQYFDLEIFPKVDNEVFIDAGSFNGDDSIDFINLYGEGYKKIYTYDPSLKNHENIVSNLKNYPRIQHFNKGVSNDTGTMMFTSHMPDTANRLHSEWGDIAVDISTIDIDISEPITFIKMDIEGAEQNALYGARRHISEETPKLAICLYHTVDDILKIPQIIYSFNSNYKFHMKQHDKDNPWELVLYCVPMEESHTFSVEKYYDVMQKVLSLLDTIDEGFDYSQMMLNEFRIEEALVIMNGVIEGINSIDKTIQPILEILPQNDIISLGISLDEAIIKMINTNVQNKENLKNQMSQGFNPIFKQWKQELKGLLESLIN